MSIQVLACEFLDLFVYVYTFMSRVLSRLFVSFLIYVFLCMCFLFSFGFEKRQNKL